MNVASRLASARFGLKATFGWRPTLSLKDLARLPFKPRLARIAKHSTSSLVRGYRYLFSTRCTFVLNVLLNLLHIVAKSQLLGVQLHFSARASLLLGLSGRLSAHSLGSRPLYRRLSHLVSELTFVKGSWIVDNIIDRLQLNLIKLDFKP